MIKIMTQFKILNIVCKKIIVESYNVAILPQRT